MIGRVFKNYATSECDDVNQAVRFEGSRGCEIAVTLGVASLCVVAVAVG